jgi:hypothetical protein
MSVQPSLRIVSTSDDSGPANVLSLPENVGLEVDVHNPTNKAVKFALVVELFQQGTLNFQTLANMHNREPIYTSRKDERYYTTKQKPFLTQVPLQLVAIDPLATQKPTHGNAKIASVAGRVQVLVKLVKICGNTYAVIEIIAQPHSGVVGERFSVNLTIDQQHAHAYRLSCYKQEQDTFKFQHDYFFVLRNGGALKNVYDNAKNQFPTIWNVDQYGKGPAHNTYFSDCLRRLIPIGYVHPVFANAQDISNTFIVQSIEQEGSLMLHNLNYDRVKKVPKRSKKQESESTTPVKRQKIQEDFSVLIQLDVPQPYYQVAQLPVAVPNQTPMTPVPLELDHDIEVSGFLESLLRGTDITESFEEPTVLEQITSITQSEEEQVSAPYASEAESLFCESPENNSHDCGLSM